MSSLKEVANMAKTSTATVSRVINGTGYVSDEMKNRVRIAITQLDYKPLERKDSTKKTRTIALITPDIENPFFAKMTTEISKIANELKYNILLINVSGLKNDGGAFLMSLIDTRVDGVIYASSFRLGDVIEKAKNSKIPLVVLDREFKTIEVDSVAVNNNQAGFIATKHLLEYGHKNIAFIGGNQYTEISVNRQDGYRRALEDSGVTYQEAYVDYGDFSMKSGYEAIKRLTEKSSEITAIVAANDLMAIGAVNYLNFKGKKIPRDISIVGFDDIELASSLTPKLTTVAYPLKRMSELAMESILKQISDNHSYCESVSLFPKLVVRESTGRV
ncbi:MAG: LacI family DNA-binding transcriptional regulator [Acidaminobacteraceae bacterium]